METNYKQLNPPVTWREGKAKTVTFVVTQDCQLRCNYCYVVGKNSHCRMDFQVARKTIDYLLNHRELFDSESLIIDFIGGEPLLEIDLIDKICAYFKLAAFKLDHPWFNSYRFSFSTNGILYNHERVQQFIRQNKTHISISISVDGTKEKHDSQRVYPDGRGCYDDVVRNIPLWQEQFPGASTKATVSRKDIPYIKESVLHLWGLGIKEVNMNVVFEDVWQEGDDLIFEDQLIQLADHILENKTYKNHFCSFFNKRIGKPMDPARDNQNWCGAGKMMAVDYMGNFYPCFRFTPICLRNRKPIVTGNYNDGIDFNKLRPFLALNRTIQSPEKCLKCEVAGGCAWCQGENYDSADSDTIYQRSTAICKMHKARVRANNYFWSRLDSKIGNQV